MRSPGDQVIGQRAAQSLVEQHEDDRHLGTLVSEPIGVAGAVALDERMRA